MKKIFFVLSILFHQVLHAQFATFKFDSLKGNINGKELVLTTSQIKADITDTSDLIIIGQNADDEKLGVKFYLTKITSTEGTWFLPHLEFIFINRNGFHKDAYIYEPNLDSFSYNFPLTKQHSSYSLNTGQTTSTGTNHFDIHYNGSIDGSRLNYSEVSLPENKPVSIEFAIARLMLNGKLVIKNKKLILTKSFVLQKVVIGSYKNQPVVLAYRVIEGKTGSKISTLFISSLDYVNKESEFPGDFIKTLEDTSKGTTEIKGGCNEHSKDCRTKIKCRYHLHFNK